jgi:hypothetical protein
MQVGDRLVTRGGNRFDPIANKNVLYFGPDGIISLGYTGLAYLDDIPTDQWLVEKMTGLFYERGKRTGALRIGRIPRWLPIGRTVWALCEELNNLFVRPAMRRIAHNTFFEVVGAGWQWRRRGRARPVLLGLIEKQASDRCELYYGARHIGRQYLFSTTPDANADLLDQLALRTRLRSIRSADEAESVLVDAIRDVASKTTVVGLNCMSILLPPPKFGRARVRYIGVDRVAARIELREGAIQSTEVPAAFSPWIVGTMGVHAPSIIGGTFTFNVGDFEVTIDAPALSGPGILGAMGSIERPRAPQ